MTALRRRRGLVVARRSRSTLLLYTPCSPIDDKRKRKTQENNTILTSLVCLVQRLWQVYLHSAHSYLTRTNLFKTAGHVVKTVQSANKSVPFAVHIPGQSRVQQMGILCATEWWCLNFKVNRPLTSGKNNVILGLRVVQSDMRITT